LKVRLSKEQKFLKEDTICIKLLFKRETKAIMAISIENRSLNGELKRGEASLI